MTDPLVRRATAAVLGALLAVGGTALTAPASAAPVAKTAVIVQLTPGSDSAAEANRAASNGGGSVSFVYTSVFRGFAGEFTPGALNGLRHNPRVTLIEADGVVTADGTQAPTPSWGLDRIDQGSGWSTPYPSSYAYPEPAGLGVTAYVVDSGIASHKDFGTRLLSGYNTVRGKNTTVDCNGHGTHVAGTIGGAEYGVAKAVSLVPVRVLDCNGSGVWSGVIAGLDWVVSNHGAGPAVANMSLGGGVNQSVDDAVGRVIADGVTVAVAAGNSKTDACTTSPARAPLALTVGATDLADNRASFSNYGSCLDLFAPGVNITSTWLKGGTNTISGTSMASPHVAGAAAVLLSQNPSLSTSAVETELKRVTTSNVVVAAGTNSPNELLRVAAFEATVN